MGFGPTQRGPTLVHVDMNWACSRTRYAYNYYARDECAWVAKYASNIDIVLHSTTHNLLLYVIAHSCIY